MQNITHSSPVCPKWMKVVLCHSSDAEMGICMSSHNILYFCIICKCSFSRGIDFQLAFFYLTSVLINLNFNFLSKFFKQIDVLFKRVNETAAHKHVSAHWHRKSEGIKNHISPQEWWSYLYLLLSVTVLPSSALTSLLYFSTDDNCRKVLVGQLWKMAGFLSVSLEKK